MAMVANNTSISDGGGGSGKDTFNLKAAQSLINQISDTYTTLRDEISNGWEDIVNVLQKNWVGVDEQNYERIFANRIVDLYNCSGKVILYTAETIEKIAKAYVEAQSANTFEGQTAIDVSSYSAGFFEAADTLISTVIPYISDPDYNIVAVRPRTFTEDMDLGLTSSMAANEIKTEINNYVNRINKTGQSSFYECSKGVDSFVTNEEVKKYLKGFIESSAEATTEINTAVRVMYDAVDKLVTQPYSGIAKNLTDNLSEAASDIKKTNIGNSRWNTTM
jgi:hypothetical protein